MSDISQLIHNLHNLCSEQFSIINQRLCELENKTKSLQSICSISSNNSNSTNFDKIDDKISYLNHNIQNVSDIPLSQIITDNTPNFITDNIIYDILNKKNNIYSASILILIDILQNNNNKLLFCFPFQKYIIYNWNIENNTWEKSNSKTIKNIFNIIQKFIIQKYNNIVSILNHNKNTEFEMKQMQFIENGYLFFVDDFDKKYNDIKKQLFIQLQQIQ